MPRKPRKPQQKPERSGRVKPFLGRFKQNEWSTPPESFSDAEIAAFAELYPLCERQRLLNAYSIHAFRALCRMLAHAGTSNDLKASYLAELRKWLEHFNLFPAPSPRIVPWEGGGPDAA